VCDPLNQFGGAERTVLEIARMWPDAPVYTPLFRPGSTFPELGRYLVTTSPLGRLPVDVHFRALLPLYPMALRSLGTLDHELVISSSSGWAHGVQTVPGTTHVVYCHSPARWLYDTDRYLSSPGQRALLRPVLEGLRRWDQRAARRADAYIANAKNVSDRIHEVYGIGSPVVHPPVDTERFYPSPRGKRLLVVSRLLPYKRIDLAIEAAARTGLGLDIVGTGPLLRKLKRSAGPTVTFHGNVDDETLRDLIQACWALCMPGAEDFGIAPLEANAAGKPAIAFAARGPRETVVNGVTGVLFDEQSVSALADAIRLAGTLATDPQLLADHAEQFSVGAFQRNLREKLEAILARTNGAGGGEA
jgi:glycosyltransferase involved in cell wall biosynthesis